MPLSKQEEFFVPEFSEEQVSIATTEFSTQAPSEINRSFALIGDDTASVSGAGSIRGDSLPKTTNVSQIKNKRVTDDFGGDDEPSFTESESEDMSFEGAVKPEEEENQESVFIKPTKPALKKKAGGTAATAPSNTELPDVSSSFDDESEKRY